ncbi:MAG: acyl-CoA thioesterase [Bacteroidota bacterium]
MKNLMPEKFKHSMRLEIRFVDVDAFGHVNNAHYLTYFEQARVKYFDEIVNWKYDWSKQGIILARAEINYKMPALFRDEIVILTRCSRIGTKSFDLEYIMVRMMDGKEVLLADAISVMVAFDYSLNQSIPVPGEWREAINKYEGN